MIRLISKTKICTGCNIEKPVQQFYFRDKKKNTYHAKCKLCYDKKNITYRDKNDKNQMISNDKKFDLSYLTQEEKEAIIKCASKMSDDKILSINEAIRIVLDKIVVNTNKKKAAE